MTLVSELAPDTAAPAVPSGPFAVLARWAELRGVRIGLTVARWMLASAVVGWLVWSLMQLGWAQIWAARPSNPAFWLMPPLLFMVQPVADRIIYRRLWSIPDFPLVVMMRKRFMNNNLMDYSGEGYLFDWARRHTAHPKSYLLHTIKDSNLLSAAAAFVVLIGLIVHVLITHHGAVLMPDGSPWPFVILAVMTLAPILGYLTLRHRMTVLDSGGLRFIFGVHLVRSALNNGFVLLAWMLALPSAPLGGLVDLLAFRLLLSRLPMVANKELVFLSAGVGLAPSIDLSQAGLAAVVLTMLAADQLLNLILVGLPLFVERRRG